MSFNKIEKTIEIFQIGARGLDLKGDTNGFMIYNDNLKMDHLLSPDILLPVLSGMADMLYLSVFDDKNFKGLFPTQLEKKSKTLCYATLRGRDDYNIDSTGYSLSTAHLMGSYIMQNVLMPNKFGKVELKNLVNLWRKELGSYKEGEIIDLNNHKKSLIDYNMMVYPKIRDDLLELRNSSLRKNIFN